MQMHACRGKRTEQKCVCCPEWLAGLSDAALARASHCHSVLCWTSMFGVTLLNIPIWTCAIFCDLVTCRSGCQQLQCVCCMS
jgi:hypothetical protein